MRRYERAVRLARQVEAKGELPKTVLRDLDARGCTTTAPNHLEIDLSEPIAASRKAMTGLSLEDAFLTFAALIPLIEPAKLREEASDSIRDNPCSRWMTLRYLMPPGGKSASGPAA